MWEVMDEDGSGTVTMEELKAWDRGIPLSMPMGIPCGDRAQGIGPDSRHSLQ